MATCRDCAAAIKFVTLDTGRPIPVDPHPFPDRGNVAARNNSGALTGYVMSRTKPLRDGYQRYLPHHATCRPPKPQGQGQRPPSLFDLEVT